MILKWNWIKKLKDVPGHLLGEITHFFQVYKELEKKKTHVGDWEEVEKALDLVEEAKGRHIASSHREKGK